MNLSNIQRIFADRGRNSVKYFLSNPGFFTSEAKSVLSVAHEAHRRGYYRECLKLMDAVNDTNRRWPKWFAKKFEFLRGEALLDSKDYLGAVKCYSALVKTMRNKSDIAYANKALALWNLKRYRAALANYLSAVKINPANAVAQRGTGEMYLKLNKPSQALGHFKKAIRHKPKYGEAVTGSGVALFQLGLWAKSFEAFQKAIHINPDDWLAKKGLAALEERLAS